MARQLLPNGAIRIAVILGLAGYLLPMIGQSDGFGVALYLLATTIFTFDLVDVGIRAWLGRNNQTTRGNLRSRSGILKESSIRPYAVVMSVRDIKADADQVLARLEDVRPRTWIIDDCSDDETSLYLQATGWRCVSSRTNRKKPAAIKELLAHLPAEIESIVVLDPDAAPLNSGRFERSDLEKLIQWFQASDAAACCPLIRMRDGNALVSFQALECELAFRLGRKGLAPHCITSGVSIYKRAPLETALDRHSLSVYAEDLENSVILLDLGYEIVFDDRLVFETDGKSSFGGWFSQRVGWSFGLARVFALRWREILGIARKSPWAFYNFAIYLGLFSMLLYPVRLAGLLLLTASFANALDNVFALGLIPDIALTDPRYFASAYLGYTSLALGLAVALRPPFTAMALVTSVAFYLFYAAVNAAAIGMGYLNWLSLRFTGRRIYRDHYVSDDSAIRIGIANA